ncbi:MAG TPA: diheme cytochrome c-553 [Mucilaginibacter sp.]|jgi:hypothetical protein
MKFLIVILFFLCFAWLLNSCSSGQASNQSAANEAPTKDSLIKRGAYLVAIIGCNDCHSPKKMGPNGPYVDTARMLSGAPANGPVPVLSADQAKKGLALFTGDLTACAGPWGTSFAANLTSDGTGIGNWSLEQFKNALRNGKYMGLKEERMIMPPMPWQDFRNMTDIDMEAIFDYLKSTKPVKNVVPSFKPAGK